MIWIDRLGRFPDINMLGHWGSCVKVRRRSTFTEMENLSRTWKGQSPLEWAVRQFSEPLATRICRSDMSNVYLLRGKGTVDCLLMSQISIYSSSVETSPKILLKGSSDATNYATLSISNSKIQVVRGCVVMVILPDC